MAITAAVRTNLIELYVLASGRSPGTAILGTLVANYNDNDGISSVGTLLTKSSAWQAKFPTFQTPEEFGKEFLEMIVPGISEAVMAEGITIIAGMLNSGSSQADVLILSSNFLSSTSATDAAFGDYAAKFQNATAVAEYHTVNQEKSGEISVVEITADAASVATAKGDIDGSTAAAAAEAAATAAAKAVADAAAATAAADAVAAAALVTAATDAAAAADTAIATSVAADTALAAAVTASTAADAAAALTDAAALATAATAAAAADTTAQATLTTATTAYTAAIAGGDAATVSLANGTKLIAAAAADTTAAASVAAAAASAAATADDTAATAATAAQATALTTSTAARAAADTAAAAAATAAAATPGTEDDTAATAAIAGAAASSASADEINAADVSTAALASATTAVAAGAAANAAATTAIAAVNSDATAAAASTAAAAAVTAAAAATTSTAAATAAAAATGATAADAASAATLAASAATQAAAATASVASATAASDSNLYPVALSLTTNTDNKTGGAGNDTFTGSGTTFNSDDILNGGAGSDTLLFTVAPAGAATVIANLTAVETLKVTNGGAGAQTLNLIGATGVEALENRLSGGDVLFTNVQGLTSVTANGTTGGETTASFLNALVAGTADTVSLSLTNNAIAHFNVGGATPAREFDVINLSSTAATLNTLSAIQRTDSNALTKKVALNVTGDANLTITTLAAGAKSSINASAFTGVLKVTTTANIDTVTGGSGNDTITIGTALAGVAAPETFDGGAGDDTIVIGFGIAATDLSNANLFGGVHSYVAETLNYKGPSANVDEAIDISTITGATTLEIDPFAADADADLDITTVTNIVGQTIVIDHATTGGAASSTTGTSVSLALKTATGAADSIDITLKNTTTASELGVLTTAANIETVNITSSGGKAYQVASPVMTGAKTLNLLGAQDLLLGTEIVTNLAASTAAANSVINASALTGKLTIGSAAVAGVEASSITLTGGSAADKFYFGATLNNNATSTVGDVIDGGDGSDTLFVTDNAGGAATQEAKSITNVELIDIDTITSGDDTVSMKNVSATTRVNITDAANAAGFGTTVSNLAGQPIHFMTSATAGIDTNFTGAAFALKNAVSALGVATGTTAMTINLDDAPTALGTADGASFAGGAITTTGVTALTINDVMAIGATNLRLSQAVDIAGAATTASSTITSVTLTGGGVTNAATGAVTTFDLDSGANVVLSTIDATGLAGKLDLDSAGTGTGTGGANTAAGASILLGSGNNSVTLDLTDAVRDSVTVNGGDGTDTLILASGNNATYRPGATSIETVSYSVNATQTGVTVLDGTDAGAVTKINLSVDHPSNATDENNTIQNFASLETITVKGVHGSGAGDTQAIDDTGATTIITSDQANFVDGGLTLADATSLTVKLGSSSAGVTTGEFVSAVVSAPKATAVTLGSSDKTALGVAYVGKIDITALTLAKATSLTIDASQGDVDLDTVTAAKLASVTITGDNAVVFGTTGAVTTALASFDASAATDVITVGQAVDFTSTASISTGTANDTVTLDVLTEANVAVAMGAKLSDSDSLVYSGANNMGTTVVDLRAADQVSQMNGAVSTSAQTGVENISFAGFTGTQGVTITGSAAANTIVGSPNADVLTGGGGVDNIAGGAGNDTIDLTESVAKIDSVNMTGAIAGLGADSVTGFALLGDLLSFTGANIGDTNTTLTVTKAAAKSAATLSELNVFTTALANDAAIVADIKIVTSTTPTLYLVYNTNDAEAQIWYDADSNVDGGETQLVSLVGVTQAMIAAPTYSATNLITLV